MKGVINDHRADGCDTFSDIVYFVKNIEERDCEL